MTFLNQIRDKDKIFCFFLHIPEVSDVLIIVAVVDVDLKTKQNKIYFVHKLLTL